MAHSSTSFRAGHPRLGGRKAGVSNQETQVRREIEAQVMAQAIRMTDVTSEELERLSPLNVLLLAMIARWKAGDLAGAVTCASIAAPYCHPRLSQTDVRVEHSLADKSDAELLLEAEELQQKLLTPVH
jgi:hypothetical protein